MARSIEAKVENFNPIGGGGKSTWHDFNTSGDQLSVIFPELDSAGLPNQKSKIKEPDVPFSPKESYALKIAGSEIPDNRPDISEYDVLTEGGRVTSIGGVRRDGSLTVANQRATGRVR